MMTFGGQFSQTTRLIKRRGLPGISPYMLAALKSLREAKENAKESGFPGEAFAELPGLHKHTLRALLDFNRDWIVAETLTETVGGTRYAITARGLKALKVYEPELRRNDGICPDCGLRPKHVYTTGRKAGYCAVCLSKQAKWRDQHGLYKGVPDRPCSRCKKKPRHQLPGGRLITYCKRCNQTLKRQGRRRRRKALLKAVQAGAPVPMCKACGERPRRVGPNYVDEMCEECRRAYQRDYHNRRKKAA